MKSNLYSAVCRIYYYIYLIVCVGQCTYSPGDTHAERYTRLSKYSDHFLYHVWNKHRQGWHVNDCHRTAMYGFRRWVIRRLIDSRLSLNSAYKTNLLECEESQPIGPTTENIKKFILT